TSHGDLASADTTADHDHVESGNRFVNEDWPAGWQADRGDSAVLHARLPYRIIHSGKGNLAYVQPLPDHPIDIGSVGGPDQTRCHHGHVSAPSGHYDAVGGDLQRNVVPTPEGSRVCSVWVDGRHEALQPKIGDCVPDRLSQEFGMVERWLPVQSSD